jgi:hypothetical protein
VFNCCSVHAAEHDAFSQPRFHLAEPAWVGDGDVDNGGVFGRDCWGYVGRGLSDALRGYLGGESGPWGGKGEGWESDFHFRVAGEVSRRIASLKLPRQKLLASVVRRYHRIYHSSTFRVRKNFKKYIWCYC